MYRFFNWRTFAVLFILWHIPNFSALGQWENIWAFGSNAGLDFNATPPEPITTSINTNEGTAIMCDENGQLLFYTDGSTVWDKNHNPMPNGHNLISSLPTQPTQSTSQGTLIIPLLGDWNKYYIFSLTSWEYEATGDRGKLYYSIVDMALNNGYGDIIPSEKSILLDTHLTEQLTAVLGNNCNIWLLTSTLTPNQFKAFEITDEGLNVTPVISNAITSTIPDVYFAGCLAVL